MGIKFPIRLNSLAFGVVQGELDNRVPGSCPGRGAQGRCWSARLASGRLPRVRIAGTLSSPGHG